MKKSICALGLVILGLLPLMGVAQTHPVWKELKTFHSLMSSTFHPSEDGNFAPLKAKADSLYIAAQLWQSSAIPANYKTDETKASLTKLVNQCAALKKAVIAKMTDDKLKKLITEAHEIFHTIVEKCKKEDK